jgi:hypothetical protein
VRGLCHLGEVPAVFNLDEKIQSGGDIVPTDYKQIFVTPAVRSNLFPGSRVSPGVSFGGGFGHFSESNKLNYFGTNPGGSSTTGVIQPGLGLDVNPFPKRFSHFSFAARLVTSIRALLIFRWPIPAEVDSIIISSGWAGLAFLEKTEEIRQCWCDSQGDAACSALTS